MSAPLKAGVAGAAVMAALADKPDGLSVAAIATLTGLSSRQASEAAQKLMKRALVIRVSLGHYNLTPEGDAARAAGFQTKCGPAAPTGKPRRAKGTFRERAWRSMRVRRRFTIGDVVADATNGSEKSAQSNAERYIRALKKAGYIRELPVRMQGTMPGSTGFKRFQLVRNTGPEAPVWREAAGTVVDHNTGEETSCAT